MGRNSFFQCSSQQVFELYFPVHPVPESPRPLHVYLFVCVHELVQRSVLAPDGTIYFVDLEGLEWIQIKESEVAEKIDDQIYRSLYEFMYAYEI